MRWRYKAITALGLCVVVLVILGVYFGFFAGFPFVAGMRTLINARERQIIYHIKHDALANEIRQYADEKRSQFPDLAYGMMKPPPAQFPNSLKVLDCNSVSIFPDRVDLEFGGSFLSFGLHVFNKGTPGNGTKKLGDGIWFYAEDGHVPAP